MSITKPADQVTDADRPFLCSRGNADGTVTLYYPGDTIPPLPDADLAAIAATLAKDAADAQAARTYAKLIALRAMSPAQVQAWVAANVTNLVQAQDAIATLAIAVSILARRL